MKGSISSDRKPAKLRVESVFWYDRAQYKHPYTMGPADATHQHRKTHPDHRPPHRTKPTEKSTRKKKKKLRESEPRTGPRPASSMPMMQGFEPHFGTGASDPMFPTPTLPPPPLPPAPSRQKRARSGARQIEGKVSLVCCSRVLRWIRLVGKANGSGKRRIHLRRAEPTPRKGPRDIYTRCPPRFWPIHIFCPLPSSFSLVRIRANLFIYFSQ